MTVGVVIPARYSSTRFPGKPLTPIAGKPMIQWVWERACRARGICQVLVATDDPRIEAAVVSFGGQVQLTSPTAPSGSDRIWEVLSGRSWDGVVNVQGDEPLVDPDLIERLAYSLTTGEAEVVTAAVVSDNPEDYRSPHVVKVVTGDSDRALYFSRQPIPHFREGEPVRFLHHVGMYAYSRQALQSFVRWPVAPLEQREKLEQLRFLHHGVRMKVLTTDRPAHGVDVPADVTRIESLLRGSHE